MKTLMRININNCLGKQQVVSFTKGGVGNEYQNEK